MIAATLHQAPVAAAALAFGMPFSRLAATSLPATTHLLSSLAPLRATPIPSPSVPSPFRLLSTPSLAPKQPSASASVPTTGPFASIPFSSSFTGHSPLDHTYTPELLTSIAPAHLPPAKLHQRAGLAAVTLLRRVFDAATGYTDAPNAMTEAKWIQRFLFLETVAGVPGMCAGMLRHLKSLRAMKRDNGWIRTLLDEAENERMHLLTFLEIRQPGPLFRAMVILAQGVFFNAYFLAYLASPRTCHAFVGYLEEEAVKTYTHALHDMREGAPLAHWATAPAPEVAVKYWQLPEGATMRDLILAVRADEAGHSHVNHALSIIPGDAANPFKPESEKIV